MTLQAKCRPALWAAIGAAALLCSCSGTSAPQPGTPAFFWAAARETWGQGDYLKTIDHLDKLSSDSEYGGRARPWLMVVTSGMAQGYVDLADAYETGARANKADPLSFRRLAANYRNTASRLAQHYAETYQDFQKSQQGDSVALAFPYPGGSATPVATLAKAANGIMPPPNEAETAQKRAVTRQVLLAACRAAGAPDDLAKTQELLKAGEAKVPRPVFLAAAARSLYDYSQLYTAARLDDPSKMKIFCERAQDALKAVPESKETKELSGKIATALKPGKRPL